MAEQTAGVPPPWNRLLGATSLLRGLLAVSVVVPPLLFAAAAWQSYRQEIGAAELQARSTVNVLREHALRVFDTHALALKQIDERIRGLDDRQIETGDLHRYLADLSRDLGSPNVLWITDANGRARASSLAFPVPELDVSDREYFIEQKRQNAGTFVSVPYQRRTGDQSWAFGISRRRSSGDGAFVGTVHVALDTRYLSDFWESAGPKLAHVVPLMRDDGELLARYPAQLGQRLKLPPNAPFPRAIARSPDGLYTAVSGVDGIERINAYRRIRGYPLTISYSIETRAVLGPWWGSLFWYGALAFLTWVGLIATTMQALKRTRTETIALRELRAETIRRQEAEDQLRQTQKMDAIGRLTGGIAHDFNNLLTIVIGSLDLLRRRMANGDARHHRLVENAYDGAKRAAVLTGQLLAFARRQSLDPKPLDINKCVSGMSEMFRRTLGEAIQIETVLVGGLWRAHVDPSGFESALLNLAINARDAMPTGGGRLTIETANAYLDEAYAVGRAEVKPGQYVMAAVTDTGTGMTQQVAARAFEPFFTTKEAGQGTGLGLAQVYGFVKQSGGHVAIYSELGVGTTVKLYLPRYLGEVQTQDTTELVITPANHHGTILVVEDEPGVRQFTAEGLRELGYDVIEADGPKAALRILQDLVSPRVTLMLTDVVMPDMNGAALALAVKGLRPEIRVLFMTGYTRNAIVHNGVLDAGTHLITKPFTLSQLAEKLAQVIGNNGEQNQETTQAPLPPSDLHGKSS